MMIVEVRGVLVFRFGQLPATRPGKVLETETQVQGHSQGPGGVTGPFLDQKVHKMGNFQLEITNFP